MVAGGIQAGDGRALLIGGLAQRSALATFQAPIAQLSEVLLASGRFETVSRLNPRGVQSLVPTRGACLLQLDALALDPSRLIVLAVQGSVVESGGEPAIVFGEPEQPNGAEPVAISSFIERLSRCPRALLFLELDSGAHNFDRAAIVAAFKDPRQLVAIAEPSSGLIEATSEGFRGDAANDHSGIVTVEGLRDHLAQLPAIDVSSSCSSEPLLLPPSPLGLWSLADTRAKSCEHSIHELAGRTLPGRFYLEEEIDKGGFGAIYAARQLSLDREVAVKIVDTPTRAATQLFVNEVRAVGRLDHPHVVRVIQADVTPDGFPFCAMELLTGHNLRTLLDDGPLPLETSLRFASQLLSALSAVHLAGVIHGDIKPDNLIITTEPTGQRLVVIDFGVSSLQVSSAVSMGGTPSYMAPEQLQGRLDRTSDLFAAALVVHEMIAGALPKRRANGLALNTAIPDHLQPILHRALSGDSAKRFSSADAFAAELEGREQPGEEVDRLDSPFRELAGFADIDQGSFYGRSEETRSIVGDILVHPTLILTAPSGVGKSSILRAGVLPRLKRLGYATSYVRCTTEGDFGANQSNRNTSEKRSVRVYDQLETLLLTRAGEGALDELLDSIQGRSASASGATILSIREDFLGRLIERMVPWSLPPILRLSPLTRSGAEEAIVMPLQAQHLSIERGALDQLLDELQSAAAELGPRMGWGNRAFIYPPHLQLTCSSLFDQVRDTATVTDSIEISHLSGLRFSDVIADHLRRLVEGGMSEDSSVIAKELLGELVGQDDTRVPRTEVDLLSLLPTNVRKDDALGTLDMLRRRGLVLPTRVDGQRGWELAHDSLVPRVSEWLHQQGFDRRRTVELLRLHVKRSTPDKPYLLSRAALRETDNHPGITADVDDRNRGPIRAADLVARSRSVHRGRLIRLVAFGLVATALGGYLLGAWLLDQRSQERQDVLRAADLGRFELIAEPFDWDSEANRHLSVNPSELSNVSLTFFGRDHDRPEQPGKQLGVESSEPEIVESSLRWTIEVRGGPAFVRVDGRGSSGESCPPSWVRLRRLPGYVDRERSEKVRIVFPTCAASRANTVDIPEGDFVSGGDGVPITPHPGRAKRVVSVPAYAIHKSEVVNALYSHYASIEAATGRGMPSYPTEGLVGGDSANHPVANIDFNEANDLCRFLGMRLPTNVQWEKAARGGRFLDAAKTVANPIPERNQPWGLELWKGRANLFGEEDGFWGTAPIASYPRGDSPYGLHDMAGNVQEWVTDRATEEGGNHRMVRGGSYDVLPKNDHHTIAFINSRDERFRAYDLGVRCARTLLEERND